jgi:Fe-S-cluster containining protein
MVDPGSPDDSPLWLMDDNKPDGERYFEVSVRYFRMHLPCGFLEDGECTIYADRPLVCRQYMVTSPAEHCVKFEYDAIDILEPPVRLADGLAEIAGLVEKKPERQVPLFAVLAWAAVAENAKMERSVSGVKLLKCMAKWVDSRSDVPLRERGGNGIS